MVARRTTTDRTFHQAIVAALLATFFVLVGCGMFAHTPPPDTADTCILRGLANAKTRPDLARADFDKAVRLAPGSATAWAARGTFLGDHDELGPALTDLNRAVELGPTPSTYYWRGLVHEKRGDYARAAADFSHAIAGNPRLADAWAHRGASRMLGPKKDWRGALADCSRAIELGPDRSAGYFSRALVQFLHGTGGPQIIADCDRTIALDPEHYQAYALRAAARQALGPRARACADVRQARSLHPEGSKGWETMLAKLESSCPRSRR